MVSFICNQAITCIGELMIYQYLQHEIIHLIAFIDASHIYSSNWVNQKYIHEK
jgi:hypothetical protein